ncbi:MAG: BON domain-containing protein [Gammaproteobacteria bacterium]
MSIDTIKRLYIITVIACIPVILPGCAAPLVIATGTVAGGAVAVDKRTAGTYVEDEAIELKARKDLLGDKPLNKQVHINFISYNTKVLVSGEAPTEELRDQVINIVKGIEKVSHIHDEIIIAAPSSYLTRTGDTTITAKVKTKLLANRDLNPLYIKVVTENGTVFLMGLITREDAEKATEITRNTGGVQKVVKLFEYTN